MTDAVRNHSSGCKVRLRGLDLYLVREAKSAVLGFPQVEHLFKTGGLRIMSGDFNRWLFLRSYAATATASAVAIAAPLTLIESIINRVTS
jgi:hypothetical protein